MSKPPDIVRRNLRGQTPSGFIWGRLDPGDGPAQLLSLSRLRDALLGPGGLGRYVGSRIVAGTTNVSNFIPSVLITKPLASEYPTWVNQNGSSVADGEVALNITWQPITAAAYQGLYRTLGASTVFTARILSTLATVNFNANGISLRESGTGKMLGIRFGWVAGFSMERETYSSPTVRTGVTTISTTLGSQMPPWWRFRITSGNVLFDFSYSGEATDWVNIDTVSVAGAFTTAPDQVGFYGSSTGSATSQSVQSALLT